MTSPSPRSQAIYRAKEAYKAWMQRAKLHPNMTLSRNMNAKVQYTWDDDNDRRVLLDGNGKLIRAFA